MVNLWGLLPVLSGWGSAMNIMTAEAKRDDGLSLHGGADEHSVMLFLAPTLVSPQFRSVPTVSGANCQESFAVAQRRGGRGTSAPRKHASVAVGKHIWEGFSAAAVKTTADIFSGVDPATMPRRRAARVPAFPFACEGRAVLARSRYAGARDIL